MKDLDWLAWLDDTGLRRSCHGVWEYLAHSAYSHALKQRITTFETDIGCDEFPEDELDAELCKRGFFCLVREFNRTRSSVDQRVYVGALGALFINRPVNRVLLSALVFDYQIVDELKRLFASRKAETSPNGLVYFLEQGPRGTTEFLAHPTKPSPFIPDNYAAPVRHAYDRVCAWFKDDKPAGRLVILNGPPGTGKSHFIRGLLTDNKARVAFCMVPPFMAADLNGPAIMRTIQNFRQGLREEGDDDEARKSMVVVLEDADNCLVRRASDNISTIAAILNMTDGIFGEALDMRIIATTNAKRLEIDDAVRRPGRLFAEIEFGELTPAHASSVLARLGLSPENVRKPMTLADIYARARQ